ncbi:hypothetical protein GCM10010271_09430 [Streptomyces kurssanovii]|nr:hypothetical protein GCM10010271_09430 [Streptomyces kurssanovii]
MVAAGQLDVAFVHEVEGCPLLVPDGLRVRVLVEREPQFVSLARDHPAAAPVVDLADLAHDRWMVDPTVDGEWDGLRRVLGAAGIAPPVLHGDYHTAASLIADGEVVAPCQPTSMPREDMAVPPLRGDPLAVRLLLFSRPGPAGGELYESVYGDLTAAYREAALRAAAYRQWLLRHKSPLLTQAEPARCRQPDTARAIRDARDPSARQFPFGAAHSAPRA